MDVLLSMISLIIQNIDILKSWSGRVSGINTCIFQQLILIVILASGIFRDFGILTYPSFE